MCVPHATGTVSQSGPALVNPSHPTEAGHAEQRIPVHPHGKRLTDNILFGHLAPYPAIAAVIAVVAHHEIVARSHHHRKIPRWPRNILLQQMALFTELRATDLVA